VDDVGHGVAGIIAIRVLAVFEKARNILPRPGNVVLRPMTETCRRDVRRPVLVVRSWPAGKALLGKIADMKPPPAASAWHRTFDALT
jgi:hypothetical protein